MKNVHVKAEHTRLCMGIFLILIDAHHSNALEEYRK
jgi:hypothetical protein